MPDEIEANAAHAAPMQGLQFLPCDVVADHGDTAPSTRGLELARPGERIEHGTVVGSVAACLDKHGSRQAKTIVQRAQLLLRRIVRGVDPLRRLGNLSGRALDVTVRTARSGWPRRT